ncbi:hypothetical protein F4778DRAFT_726560 [Xylariomycetidae sp. FL2044]|nr:hypothetical protein F4778DRAFT_726560 [Xylariomycetidae sp. FL2044]
MRSANPRAGQSPGAESILNTPYPADSDASFTCFSRLPTELRLKIWTASLQRHRIVKVSLKTYPRGDVEGDSDHVESLYSQKNSLGNTISGGRYIVTYEGTKSNRISLLAVNAEARQAALEFYRVQFPCYTFRSLIAQWRERPRDRSMRPEDRLVLYFNPEYDFLDNDSFSDEFTYFLYDIKAYDPKRIGLLNLATTKMLNMTSLGDIPTPPPQAIESLRDTVQNLQRMVLICLLPLYRRDPEHPKRARRVYYTRSLPLYSSMESFDWHDRDPRPLDIDVTSFSILRHFDLPGYLYHPVHPVADARTGWQQFEATLGVRRGSAVDVRYAVALSPIVPGAAVHQQAVMEYQDQAESAWSEKISTAPESIRGANPYQYSDVKGQLPMAVGFWMSGPYSITKSLSLEETPELCLFDMPRTDGNAKDDDRQSWAGWIRSWLWFAR